MNHQMQAEHIENNTGVSAEAPILKANDYTFPYLHISADKKVTVISKDTMNAVLDTCDLGHQFLALPNHPVRDGKKRCVYCLAQGFDSLRAESMSLNPLTSVK